MRHTCSQRTFRRPLPPTAARPNSRHKIHINMPRKNPRHMFFRRLDPEEKGTTTNNDEDGASTALLLPWLLAVVS
jgi:hypothetical protein